MSDASAPFFAADSPLKNKLNHFSIRPAQQKLSEAITETIDNAGVLIAEAATGTGKTFAYLIPAMLANKKVIISTGTRNLQDQLYQRDLPLLQKAIGKPLKIALLKGRSNYLCRYRIELNAVNKHFQNKKMLNHYQHIQAHVDSTATGDIAELSTIPEDAAIWPQVTSTVHNCLGQECPVYQKCFLLNARKQAMQADLIVINHHLFFADSVLKNGGFGELLPQADVYVFDEAHHLPDIASRFFGQYLSMRQLSEFVSDTQSEIRSIAKDMGDLQHELERLQVLALQTRELFIDCAPKAAWLDACEHQAITEHFKRLQESMRLITEQLALAAVRSRGLEQCWIRAQDLVARLSQLGGQPAEDYVHWYELGHKSLSIHLTPMEIASEFKAMLQKPATSWIFTSATLSVDGQFEHYQNALGLEQATTLLLASPFNYPQQAVLYLPRGMRDPHAHDYYECLSRAAIPLIAACQGRCFFLFTSHQALKQMAELLKTELSYPLFIQGEQPKNQLLDAFRAHGHAVLLGTASFWQGVDVQGQALSCVIIDKLPFENPHDPIMQARSKRLKAQGQDMFYDYQIPRAVIALKQGVGRLIRDAQDFGVLMIADPRLTAREYGKLFFRSLPKMTRTRQWQQVKDFIESWDNT